MDRHERIFQDLERRARALEPDFQSRHMAAILYKNEVISYGTNRAKTHPWQAKYGKNKNCVYLHAEIDAIQIAARQYGTDILERSSIYVARMKWDSTEKNYLSRAISKPCAGCMRAIAAFGIRNAYFTCEEEGYDML